MLRPHFTQVKKRCTIWCQDVLQNQFKSVAKYAWIWGTIHLKTLCREWHQRGTQWSQLIFEHLILLQASSVANTAELGYFWPCFDYEKQVRRSLVKDQLHILYGLWSGAVVWEVIAPRFGKFFVGNTASKSVFGCCAWILSLHHFFKRLRHCTVLDT